MTVSGRITIRPSGVQLGAEDGERPSAIRAFTMAQTTLTETDEGKKVLNHEGTEIGMITGFRGGKAYVDPDPGLTDSLMSKLGWSDVGDDDYAIENSSVERITDDEVHLLSHL